MAGHWIPRVELRGVQASIQSLNAAREIHIAALNVGTARMARDILGRSQHYVPVDTAFLKSTGDYGPEGNFTRDDIRYVVSYAAPYAIFVHEDAHAYHAPPTGFKYLERAVREVTAENSQHILFDIAGTMAVTGHGFRATRELEPGELMP